MHVPLVFSGASVAGPPGRVDGLCSLLDLVPTLCDAAGIAKPGGLAGRSLFPFLRDESRKLDLHEAVVAEWHTEYGHTIEPGRMVRTATHKYTHYLEGDGEELYDLEEDPGEMRNLAPDRASITILKRHRRLLQKHLEESGDPYKSFRPEVAPAYRKARPCYRFYTGPLASDSG